MAGECDVVQVIFTGFQFFGVFFCSITQLSNVAVAVYRVTVKAHFSIETFQIAAAGDDQRVDLQHLHIFFQKKTVQVAHQSDALFGLLAIKAKIERDAAAVKALVTGGRINGERQDFLRGGFCHFFDVHATFGRGYKGNTACLAVHKNGKIKFFFNVRTVFDIYSVDQLAGGTSLLGHQSATQHCFGFFFGFFDRTGQTHAACSTGVCFNKTAFTASACVDLSFDNPKRAIHLAGGCFGFIGPQHNSSVADWCPIAAQKGFCLIFVNVHRDDPTICSLRHLMHIKGSNIVNFCGSAFFRTFVITGKFFVITKLYLSPTID